MEFAGAKNSLIYIQNKELKTLKASRFSVGGRPPRDLREHENREIELSEPTFFYLSTDGFQDQLGGPRGRKFMSKYFQELLYENPRKTDGRTAGNFEPNHRAMDGGRQTKTSG